jgi:hypothetical protein
MATERNPFDPIPEMHVTKIEIETEQEDTDQEATMKLLLNTMSQTVV